MNAITPIINTVGSIIDKVIPDRNESQRIKLEIARLQQDGDFREIELRLNAIMMEAKSADPWTSRARPTFLYVMYLFILFAIPMGFLSAYDPDIAKQIADGSKAWLESLPTELYALFGAVSLGYVKKRSDDKAMLLGQEPKKLLGIF